jgi:mono/diheme cytochrome c family protein
MYSTGVLVGEAPEERPATGAVYDSDLVDDGVLAHTRWRNPGNHTPAAVGHDLYRAWCQVCHTVDHYNGLGPFMAVRSEEQIATLLPVLGNMRVQMPPWPAEPEAAEALAAYLAGLDAGDDLSLPDDPAEAQQLAWDLHCGLCHTLDEVRPLRDSLLDVPRDELEEWLDTLTDFDEGMPEYLHTGEVREHLLDYLEAVASGEERSES